jgi:hypothetical protein
MEYLFAQSVKLKIKLNVAKTSSGGTTLRQQDSKFEVGNRSYHCTSEEYRGTSELDDETLVQNEKSSPSAPQLEILPQRP